MPDAVHAAAQVGEAGAERGEERKRLDEAVREPEGDPDQNDRRPSAEADEHRVAQAPEGQLLHERRHDADDEAVRNVRGSVIGLPCVGCHTLFAAWVQ